MGNPLLLLVEQGARRLQQRNFKVSLATRILQVEIHHHHPPAPRRRLALPEDTDHRLLLLEVLLEHLRPLPPQEDHLRLARVWSQFPLLHLLGEQLHLHLHLLDRTAVAPAQQLARVPLLLMLRDRVQQPLQVPLHPMPLGPVLRLQERLLPTQLHRVQLPHTPHLLLLLQVPYLVIPALVAALCRAQATGSSSVCVITAARSGGLWLLAHHAAMGKLSREVSLGMHMCGGIFSGLDINRCRSPLADHRRIFVDLHDNE